MNVEPWPRWASFGQAFNVNIESLGLSNVDVEWTEFILWEGFSPSLYLVYETI